MELVATLFFLHLILKTEDMYKIPMVLFTCAFHRAHVEMVAGTWGGTEHRPD